MERVLWLYKYYYVIFRFVPVAGWVLWEAVLVIIGILSHTPMLHLLFFGEILPYKTDKKDTTWAVPTSQRKLLSNAAAEVFWGGVQGFLSCRSSFLEYSSIKRQPSQHNCCHPISPLRPFLRPFFRCQASRTSRFSSVTVPVVFPHYKDWPGQLHDWPLALPASFAKEKG